MGYELVKPRVVRSCVVYVRKTSNFGPCIRNLTGQSIRGASLKKWLMRHVAAKTSKRIQKSSFFWWEKEYTSELLCVCVCKGCKRMPVVTVMT